MGYREIDHTADVGLEIQARTLNDLFIDAALGMFHLMLRDEEVIPDHRMHHSFPIRISADNLDELFHDWLAELLSLSEAHHFYFTQFHLSHVDENSLEGKALGSKITDQNQMLLTPIKAVTYHKLSVEKTSRGYKAQVIFDV